MIEYNYNQEVVIHHILEGTLSPHLMAEEEPPPLEQPTVEPLEVHPLEEGYSILEGRRGVYDYDEFDVFNRGNIDLSKVHIGKK